MWSRFYYARNSKTSVSELLAPRLTLNGQVRPSLFATHPRPPPPPFLTSTRKSDDHIPSLQLTMPTYFCFFQRTGNFQYILLKHLRISFFAVNVCVLTSEYCIQRRGAESVRSRFMFFCFQLCLDHTLDNFAFGENFAALTLKVDLPPPFPPLNVTDVKRGTNKCVDGFLPCLVQEQPCISTLRHHLSPIPLSNTSRTWRAIRHKFFTIC